MNSLVSMTVHSKFLYGTDQEEFNEGFNAFISLLCMLYGDIASDPSRFKLYLKKIVDDNIIDTIDRDKSHASFIQIPNLLLTIGIRGELLSDYSLAINSKMLLTEAKSMKITNLPILFSALANYGFETTGLSENIENNILYFSHVDNKTITVALKAMSEALLELCKSNRTEPINLYKGDVRNNKHYFYMMHKGLLEKEKVRKPKLTIETIYQVLDGSNREFAAELHKISADITKHEVQMCGNGYAYRGWRCIYTDTIDNKVLMTLNAYMDNLNVKLNLHHIDQYFHMFEKQPLKLRDIYDSYGFNDLTGRNADDCLNLLKQEIIYRKSESKKQH